MKPTILLLVSVILVTVSLRAQDPTALETMKQRDTVVISPQNVTMSTGALQQFSATGSGATAVRWRATGGTISASGLYTAGATPGSFTITASTPGATSTIGVVVVAGGGSGPGSPVPVSLKPGDSIQSAVNANPAGTSFLITRGVYARQSVRPKDGMSFVGEAGAVLDGESATPQAFVANGARNVTLRGLRITRYTPPSAAAAVEGHGSQGWIVEGNEIDNNGSGDTRAYGLRIGSGWQVRNNTIHHNGWVGIAGYQAVGTLIEGNDVYANPSSLTTDTIGEKANIKLFDCGQITIRGNQVHDSLFRGIWLDRSRPDMTVEGNRIINHGEAGIWYEVSYRGVIRGNYVENAGSNSYYSSGWLRGGGIQVTNSPDVSVLNNTVVNSLNGIIGLQAAGYADGAYGANELRNLLVQGNSVVMMKGQTGIAQNIGTNAVYVSWNNVFKSNSYVLGTNPSPFYWMGLSVSESQWLAYGAGVLETFAR
jgi:parallel beta-helix repeat protein